MRRTHATDDRRTAPHTEPRLTHAARSPSLAAALALTALPVAAVWTATHPAAGALLAALVVGLRLTARRLAAAATDTATTLRLPGSDLTVEVSVADADSR